MQAPLALVAALALAACATGGAAAEGSAPGPSAAPPDACERAPLAAGVTEHKLESSGVARRFLLRVPSAASGPMPIVLNLHGSGGTPEDQLALSGLGELADAQGFVLVAPEGYERMWNVPPDSSKPDDVRFIAGVLDAVGALVCVNGARVYSTGFSGGGRMSSQLACDLSPRIAAIAAVGGIRFPGPCAQARPFPVLAFHGTADDVNPYDGGGRPYWGTGVEAAVSGWATHNGCPTRTDEEVSASVRRIAYTSSGGGACSEVVLYRIEGLGHDWPPGALVTPPAENAGTTNELLWSFFTRHPLP